MSGGARSTTRWSPVSVRSVGRALTKSGAGSVCRKRRRSRYWACSPSRVESASRASRPYRVLLTPGERQCRSAEASRPVTDRSLLESPPTRARSLKGRPLGMGNSLMLPELSRLSLLEPGSRFVTALGERRRPMTGLNELREQGRITWIEEEHGWIAAPEELRGGDGPGGLGGPRAVLSLTAGAPRGARCAGGAA